MRAWLALIAAAVLIPVLKKWSEGSADPVGDAVDAAATSAGDLVSAVRSWVLPDAAAPYASQIAATEAKYGLPEGLLGRQLQQESSYNPAVINGTRTSSAGALGIAQFMPSTAASLGIDPLDPSQAIDAAGKMMAQLYAQFGDWAKALAAYNWGSGNVSRKGMANAPTETRNYVQQILADVGLS